MNLDDMMAAAQKPGFKAIVLPAKLKAHMVSTVRPFDPATLSPNARFRS